MSYEKYYLEELSKLRSDAQSFADQHPNVAQFLRKPSGDPDVERLLQGMAYLLAGTNRRLDDQLPEVLSVFIDAIDPEMMRPLPATTIMEFNPRSSLRQAYTVEAGTNIDSQPVNDISCRFTTTQSVDVLPMEIDNATCVASDDVTIDPKTEFRIDFKCLQTPLAQIAFDHLSLYCVGDTGEAADLLAYLDHALTHVEIRCANETVKLPKSVFRFIGFDQDFTALPSTNRQLPGVHQIVEFFACPEKFMFFQLDLSQWTDRPEADQFSLSLLCESANSVLPPVNKHRFRLHCTPAVNLFSVEGDPIKVDQKQTDYAVNLPGNIKQHAHVYSVENVAGIIRGTGEKRAYQPYIQFQSLRHAAPTFRHVQKRSATSESVDHSLQFGYPEDTQINAEEVLIPSLICTNGHRAENLDPGSISVATSNSPELVTFRNITLPSSYAEVSLGESQQWQSISHFVSNFRSMLDVNEFKTLLMHYLEVSRVDKASRDVNMRKIESIAEINAEQKSRVLASRFIQGTEITFKIRRDHFASRGDMLCFGQLINQFFATCRPINSFTQLVFEDVYSGEKTEWPIQMGSMPTL